MRKTLLSILFVVLVCSLGFAQINQPSGSGSGTVSANNGSAGAIANYAAAGGSTTVGPDATLVDNGATLAYSGTTGIVAPSGSASAPGLVFSGATTTGFSRATTNIVADIAGVAQVAFNSSNGVELPNGNFLAWSGSADPTAAQITTLSSPSSGVVQAGVGGSSAGKFGAAAFQSLGTKYTQDTGCGTIVTSSGGATAGQFTTVGSTSCTTVITFGNSATAAHNWACFAHDLTTSVDYNNPHVSSNTTTATIVTGTIVSGDVIEFGCIGY